MLRSTFAKGKPKKMFYRCNRNFDNKKFEEELQKRLSSVSDFESFQVAFKVIFNQFAPLKQKLIQNNNQPLITETLRIRKAIMKRSKLSLMRKEMLKIGLNICTNATFVQIY